MRAHLANRRVVGLGLTILGVAAAAAAAHPERPTRFPDPARGSVPEYRTTGPAHVVCQAGSARRIRQLPGRARRRNLRLLRRCGFGSIQEAVDASNSGDRVLILPGRYTEPSSREQPVEDPRCADHYTTTTHGDARSSGPSRYRVPTYAYHLHCPNSRNLVAIVGDTDGDRRCDRRCSLQIQGTGRRPGDVVIRGDRRKPDVIHADRADGIAILNLTVEHGASNGINVIETNGFRLGRIVARANQNYGVLTFTTDHGLYRRVTAYRNGHAGLYPGSSAEGGCRRYSIEMDRVEAYENTYGYSGTGANSVWVHDSRFHHNATGLSTDSLASAHPGMPQDCARWERNRVYANNYAAPFSEGRAETCRKPFPERDPQEICPYYAAPIGTGMQIAGGNRNLVRDNRIYDNWRSGIRLFWLPAAVRADPNPLKAFDTSNGNRFVGNRMGVGPGGRRAPNGVDFWWDEEGTGNCWSGNAGPRERTPTSDPPALPDCEPAPPPFTPPDPVKVAEQIPCAAYDPQTNTRALGCPWLQPLERPVG